MARTPAEDAQVLLLGEERFRIAQALETSLSLEESLSLAAQLVDIEDQLKAIDPTIEYFYTHPAPFILDSDWWNDVDDIMAARVLAWGHTHGKIQLVAAVTNITAPNSAASLDGFLKSDGLLTDIPIGTALTSHTLSGVSPYHSMIKTRTAGLLDSARIYPDAVTVYRQVLANTVEPVDIVSVGYLNNLQELFESGADNISALTGTQLVARKVRHLWVMGGQYPAGVENNFTRDSQSQAAAVLIAAQWPSPITYNGVEIGNGILTGGNLIGTESTDILAQALLNQGFQNGRSSWDNLAALVAIRRDVAAAGYRAVHGTNVVNPATGGNTFTAKASAKDRYLVKVKSNLEFQTEMNFILSRNNWYRDSLPFL